MRPPPQYSPAGWGAGPQPVPETHTLDAPPPAQPAVGGLTVAQPSPHQLHAPAAQPAPAPGQGLVGRVKLVVEQGKILGEQFLLSERECIIGRYDAGSGRCPDIDLTAQDPAYVHRQHARIVFGPHPEALTVYDMGGRNGSYVNNQVISRNGSATLRVGDKLRIGRVVLRLQMLGDPDPREPGRA